MSQTSIDANKHGLPEAFAINCRRRRPCLARAQSLKLSYRFTAFGEDNSDENW